MPSLPSGFVLDVNPGLSVFTDDAGTTPVASDNDAVRSLREQSSNSYLFVQFDGFPYPKWRTNRINGLPSVAWGSESRLRNSVSTDLLTGGQKGMILAAVLKLNTDGGWFSQDAGGGATKKWFATGGHFMTGTKLGFVIAEPSPSNEYLTTHTVDNVWRLFIFRRKTNGDWSWRMDGAAHTSGSDATVNLPTGIALGADLGAAEANGMNGEMARILLYDGADGDDDSKAGALESYMLATYFPSVPFDIDILGVGPDGSTVTANPFVDEDVDVITPDISEVTADPKVRVNVIFVGGAVSGAALSILSIDVLDSTHLKVSFTGGAKNNAALVQPGNYVTSPVLNVLAVVPEATTNPTFVTLTISEMKQGQLYNFEIQNIEAA